jgi:hypothetical protein
VVMNEIQMNTTEMTPKATRCARPTITVCPGVGSGSGAGVAGTGAAGAWASAAGATVSAKVATIRRSILMVMLRIECTATPAAMVKGEPTKARGLAGGFPGGKLRSQREAHTLPTCLGSPGFGRLHSSPAWPS